MREVGSVWFVYSTTLLEPAKGETDDLGYVTKRLALIFYTLFPTHILLRGGARWEMENGWKRVGAAGKSESSLEWGLRGCAGADRNGHIPDKNIIPHVRERFCQSTSSPIALRGASSA